MRFLEYLKDIQSDAWNLFIVIPLLGIVLICQEKIEGQTSQFKPQILRYQTIELSYLNYLPSFDSLIVVRSKSNQIQSSETSKKNVRRGMSTDNKEVLFPKTNHSRTDFQYATYLIRKIIVERGEVKSFFH